MAMDDDDNDDDDEDDDDDYDCDADVDVDDGDDDDDDDNVVDDDDVVDDDPCPSVSSKKVPDGIRIKNLTFPLIVFQVISSSSFLANTTT